MKSKIKYNKRRTSTKSQDVLNSRRLGALEREVDLLAGHVGAREVHHGLETAEVLRGLADFEGELASASASTPRHIDPYRVEE